LDEPDKEGDSKVEKEEQAKGDSVHREEEMRVEKEEELIIE
jgi:hypothetical protein